jgi:hypothetical protein
LELLKHLKKLRHRRCDTIILNFLGGRVPTGDENVPKSASSALFKGTHDKYGCDLVNNDVIVGLLEGFSAQGSTPEKQQCKTYRFAP